LCVIVGLGLTITSSGKLMRSFFCQPIMEQIAHSLETSIHKKQDLGCNCQFSVGEQGGLVAYSTNNDNRSGNGEQLCVSLMHQEDFLIWQIAIRIGCIS